MTAWLASLWFSSRFSSWICLVFWFLGLIVVWRDVVCWSCVCWLFVFACWFEAAGFGEGGFFELWLGGCCLC